MCEKGEPNGGPGDPDIAGQLMEYEQGPVYFQPQHMPQQLHQVPLVQSIEDLADAVIAMRNRNQPVVMSELLEQLRNVIAICVQQPKFLVRRRDRNAIVVAPMTEKQLYKLLREIGLVTYIDVRRTELDKLVKKDEFQRNMHIFHRGEDGLYHELNRS
jgi:hypothetical protein